MSPSQPPTRAALQHDLARTGAASRWVEAAPGVRLHVLSYAGDGPPVLVLPGITSPAVTWDFVARELRGAAQLHVLDLRGRGLSDQPAHGYGLADYVADTAAVADALALEAPVLLGHSLGARIAAAAAVAQPALARALVLVDPPLSGPGRGPYPTSLEAFLQQLAEARAGTDADGVRRHFPRWPEAELGLRARWLATCAEAAVAETHRGFERDDFLTAWRALRTPAWLVHGGDSAVVTADGVRELRDARPDAAFVEIPGAGHMVPWDALAPFAAAVERLLRSLPPDPTR